MGQEKEHNLDDLMLGNVGEDVGESDEQFAVRLAAAQAKLAQMKKDEALTKDFDVKLAKIIRHLHHHTLRLVVFLINHEVPSLTILSIISLASSEAGKICYTEFHKYIDQPVDFSPARLDQKAEEKISLWWSFIFAADHISQTVRLHQFRHDDVFVEFISLAFSEMLFSFLEEQKEEHFDKVMLEKILKKYESQMFAEQDVEA